MSITWVSLNDPRELIVHPQGFAVGYIEAYRRVSFSRKGVPEDLHLIDVKTEDLDACGSVPNYLLWSLIQSTWEIVILRPES